MLHCHIASSPPGFILRSSVLFWLLILLHDLPPSSLRTPPPPPRKSFSVYGAEKFYTDGPLRSRSFSHSLYFGPQTLGRCLYSGSSCHLVLGNFVTHFSLIHFLIFFSFFWNSLELDVWPLCCHSDLFIVSLLLSIALTFCLMLCWRFFFLPLGYFLGKGILKGKSMAASIVVWGLVDSLF